MSHLSPAGALFWLLAGCGVEEGPPPIVLISLDTLRADRLGSYGNTRGLSPNLDRFAEQALVFDRCYAQANETLHSHASLFSARYTSELGPLSREFRYPEDVPSLAEVLQLYGYRTGAAVAGGHLNEAFGLQHGFQLYVTAQEWGSLYHTVPVALQWLSSLEGEDPFFLFLHGYDAHSRYLKPTPFGYALADPTYDGPGQTAVTTQDGTVSVFGDHLFEHNLLNKQFDYDAPYLWGPENLERLEQAATKPGAKVEPLGAQDHEHIRDVYDGAVRYLDAMFGFFMAGLQEQGLLDEVVVAVVSDHGESLGERGVYNHRYRLADEELQVVLMIRPPGGLEGGRHVQSLVGLYDVMPTLLDMAGAQAPALLRGRSLTPYFSEAPPERDHMFAECGFRQVSVRSASQRLSFQGLSADSPYLADLIAAAPLDGPAFVAEPAVRDATALEPLRQELVSWKRSLPRAAARDVEPLDPEIVRGMQEHGYWESQ